MARRFNGGKTIKKESFLAPQARAQSLEHFSALI
jgi:hypothetical protein